MKAPSSTQSMHQICLSKSRDGDALVLPTEADAHVRRQEKLLAESSLEISCPRGAWPKDSHLSFSPHPMIVTERHNASVQAIHDALVLAVTNIIERWWTDRGAKFPQRMPLEPQEEALLQWMDTLDADTLPPYRERRGSWRPDFLVEKVTDPMNPSLTIEQFRVCEINARFCCNGLLHAAHGQQALSDLGAEEKGFAGATDPSHLLNGLFTLFDPTRPLHLLKSQEAGIDIPMFAHYAEHLKGVRLAFIRPEDLRLIPDENAKLGNRLCCTAKIPGNNNTEWFVYNGETLEEIHQVGLELYQHELRGLSPEIMRALAVRCFNDMRTIFFVHDKRLLGIIHQELEDLVHKHSVLTPTQAEVLRQGITPTILAGSPELNSFAKQCRAIPTYKDGFVLKPIRSAKGAGILFGDELTPEEWEAKLGHLRDASIIPGQVEYIVQRQIRQIKYDVFMREREGLQSNFLIGTYHAIHGECLGLGVWRSGPGRICAISHGGAWMCSVISTGLS